MSDRLLTDIRLADIQHEEISLEELGHPIVYCKIKDSVCVIEEGTGSVIRFFL